MDEPLTKNKHTMPNEMFILMSMTVTVSHEPRVRDDTDGMDGQNFAVVIFNLYVQSYAIADKMVMLVTPMYQF